MIFKFYISKSTKFFSEDEILEMLKGFREYNEKNDITGMLLYKAGHFLQLLEGDARINHLYEKIEKDSRHSHVKLVLDGEYEKRIFDMWTMAYKSVDSIDHEMEKKLDEIINSYDRNTALKRAMVLGTLKKFFFSA